MFAFKVIKAQWKYKLVEEYRQLIPFQVHDCSKNRHVELIPGIKPGNSLLAISKGYSWDGPSGPTIDTPDFMRASLVHDALYGLMNKEFISRSQRGQVDIIFRDMLKEDKMPWFRRQYVYWAVKLFGWISFL